MSLFDRLTPKTKINENTNANPANSANSANLRERNASLFARLAGLALASSHIPAPSASSSPALQDSSDDRGEQEQSDVIAESPMERVYSWALQHLRFGPVDGPTSQSLKIPSGEMDGARIRTLASELRMTERELRAGLDRLVAEGDLKVKTERGRRIYWLAPPRYG